LRARASPATPIAIAAGAAVILAGGFLLSETGNRLAEQTGLGESFFGAVFLALSTSLPEISIVLAAVTIAGLLERRMPDSWIWASIRSQCL
jgi:Ca2+/Na+ antiporter